MLELFIKRENWDGGIWMELPADEEAVKRVLKELEEKASSIMIPFIGDVRSPIRGLERFLIGEFAFRENHMEILNQLAEKMNSWSEKECAVFEAALQMEKSDSIAQVLAVTEHLERYELQPHIITAEQLGHFILEREKQRIPAGMEAYFDYGRYGAIHSENSDIMTEAGLVVRKEDKAEEKFGQEKEIDSDRVLSGTAVFQLFFTSRAGRERLQRNDVCLELPASDSELEKIGEKLEISEIRDVVDYEIWSRILYLFDYLPPRCSVGELNQAAQAIREVSDQELVSRKKLLASLEAEAPRDIDAVCRVIHSHKDYEFLPMDVLRPIEYAKYILNLHHVVIEPYMEMFYNLSRFGQEKIKESGFVETDYGILFNKARPIPEIEGELKEFRFYNSLALSAYWNDSDSFMPEILSGETAISYQNMIQEKIDKSLEDCPERGLAQYLSNEVLKRRVSSMVPGTIEYAGELYGVLTVKTYGELNQREMEALREEWKVMADGGWGEELFYRPIRTERGELYIGFWDTDNNDNLFIKTEEEFRQDCLDGMNGGQEGQGRIQEPSL